MSDDIHQTGAGTVRQLQLPFSFFVRMKLHFSSIPYSPTIEHGDRSVHLVEFDQKVHELFRPAPDIRAAVGKRRENISGDPQPQYRITVVGTSGGC